MWRKAVALLLAVPALGLADDLYLKDNTYWKNVIVVCYNPGGRSVVVTDQRTYQTVRTKDIDYRVEKPLDPDLSMQLKEITFTPGDRASERLPRGLLMNVGGNDIPLMADTSTGKITFTAVVQLDSTLTADALYTRAREWFAQTYVSATAVIQMDDPASGRIVGRAQTDAIVSTFVGDFHSGVVNYNISIYVKPGRYKYVITDFIHSGGGNMDSEGPLEKLETEGNLTDGQWRDVKDNVARSVHRLIAELRSFMEKPITDSNEDW